MTKCLQFRPGFLSLSTADILGQIMFHVDGQRGGGFPVHCRMCSSFPGLYPLNPTSSHTPTPIDGN